MKSLHQLSAPAVKILFLFAFAAVLSACGGSSGGSRGNTTQNAANENDPETTLSDTINYDGPASRDDQVQRYRTEIWTYLARENYCGDCHVANGQGTTAFADTSNVNNAYDAAVARGLLTESSPLASRIAAGHQNACWLEGSGANATCAAQIQGWINAFLDDSVGEQSFVDTLGLVSVSGQQLGDIKKFYDSAPPEYASSELYLLLKGDGSDQNPGYCVDCHSQAGATRQQSPFFADDDVTVAYNALKGVLVVSDSDAATASDANSTLTKQVLSNHQGACWGDGCTSSANALHAAIVAFINNDSYIETIVYDDTSGLVASRTVKLEGDEESPGDAIVPESGKGRIETNVIAKWAFSTTETGAIAQDTSAASPDIPLTLYGDVERLSTGGVRINDGKLQARVDDSTKLYDRITTSGEYSIEAWVVPLNIAQANTRIVTYAGDDINRNFALGQNLYDYDFYARSSATDSTGGMPIEMVPEEPAQATLQYVVATYSATDGRRVYVNGELVSVEPDPAGAGGFGSWDRNFVLAVGSTVTNENQWQGSVRFLAIHDREMSVEDIQTNYSIGVGTKYYLMFPISGIDSAIPDESYIVMQVEKFDETAYLFDEPFYVTLATNAPSYNFDIEGIRIGVNGQIATAGQAFTNIDLTVTSADVSNGEGRQILSSVGTVIGLDLGSTQDRFFLSFEQLGSQEDVIVGAEVTLSPPENYQGMVIPDGEAGPSDVGVKTFDEINEALSALTGVDKTQVSPTFNLVRKSLPVEPQLETFAASHQMGIAQLAVAYCKALVDDTSKRAALFDGFNFDAEPLDAFGLAESAQRYQIIDPLLERLLAHSVNQSQDQVVFSDARSRLDGLVTALINNCSSDSCLPNGVESSRVENIVTGTCATAFASGMMLIQ